jgi:hypothetical protein
MNLEIIEEPLSVLAKTVDEAIKHLDDKLIYVNEELSKIQTSKQSIGA